MARRAGHRRLGKLIQLGLLLNEHSAEVEADLAEYYGLDLSSLTVRRAWVLITQLPAHSRTNAALEPSATWTVGEHLLATLIDAVVLNTWVLSTVNSKKAPPKPQPIKRPGSEEVREVPKQTSGMALAAFFGS